MKNMWNTVKQVLANEQGQGMVEYGLILSLIAVAAIAGLVLIGPELSSMFTDVAGKL